MVASTPSTRLTQVQDFLKPKESLGESGARNVYIISAARTPTGKVSETSPFPPMGIQPVAVILTEGSSMEA